MVLYALPDPPSSFLPGKADLHLHQSRLSPVPSSCPPPLALSFFPSSNLVARSVHAKSRPRPAEVVDGRSFLLTRNDKTVSFCQPSSAPPLGAGLPAQPRTTSCPRPGPIVPSPVPRHYSRSLMLFAPTRRRWAKKKKKTRIHRDCPLIPARYSTPRSVASIRDNEGKFRELENRPDATGRTTAPPFVSNYEDAG